MNAATPVLSPLVPPAVAQPMAGKRGGGENIFWARLPRAALVPRLPWAIIGPSLRDFSMALARKKRTTLCRGFSFRQTEATDAAGVLLGEKALILVGGKESVATAYVHPAARQG